MLCIRGVDGTKTECHTLEKVKALRIDYQDIIETLTTSIKCFYRAYSTHLPDF